MEARKSARFESIRSDSSWLKARQTRSCTRAHRAELSSLSPFLDLQGRHLAPLLGVLGVLGVLGWLAGWLRQGGTAGQTTADTLILIPLSVSARSLLSWLSLHSFIAHHAALHRTGRVPPSIPQPSTSSRSPRRRPRRRPSPRRTSQFQDPDPNDDVRVPFSIPCRSMGTRPDPSHSLLLLSLLLPLWPPSILTQPCTPSLLSCLSIQSL